MRTSRYLSTLCQPVTECWSCKMVPRKVYQLCHVSKTVSSELARDPTQNPVKVFHDLYETSHPESVDSETPNIAAGKDNLALARECGQWGNTQPSPLFLQVHDYRTLCSPEYANI